MSNKQTVFSRIKGYFSAILNSYKKGFSLIELSIVLIVVSVLIVGAIKGTELINNAKIVKVLGELNTFTKATNDFVEKYNVMPGLLTNASSIIPGAIDSEGSSNGYINSDNSLIDKNSFLFFNHLSYANFLGRDIRYDGGVNVTKVSQITSKSYPFSKGFKTYFYYVRGDTVDGMFNQANRIALSDKNGNGLTSSILQAIDSKIDDGMPLTGTVAVVPTALTSSSSCLSKETNGTSWEKNIVYSTKGSNCGVFQILDDGVNIPNKNAEIGVEEEGCTLNTKNLTSGNYIIERKINNMTSGSEIYLSCVTGYEIKEAGKNRVKCKNGSLDTSNFSGCIKSGCDSLPSVTVADSTTTAVSFRLADGTAYTGKLVSNGTNITSYTSCKHRNLVVTGDNEYVYKCTAGSWVKDTSITYDKKCEPNNRPFEIKIKTTAANEEFTIPYYNGSDNGANNCVIDWGDGTDKTACDTTTSYKNTHTYVTAGTYTIKIQGIGFRGVEFFNNSTSAKKIIELVSYGDWDNIKNLYGAFEYASNLITINQDAFKYIPNALNFEYAFAYCSGLASIPSGLFDNNTKVTIFAYTFYNCSKLASIPSGLFDNNTKVQRFNSTFRGCSKLTSIPSGLFDNNTKVTSFNSTFLSCSSLASIPDNLFVNNENVTSFYSTFYGCTGLTSVPSTLFTENINVTDFQGVFSGATGLACVDIDGTNSATEYTKGYWSKWNNGATMTNAKYGCKVYVPFKIEIDISTSDKTFTIPFYTGSENGTENDCTIDWGDGSKEKCGTTSNSHTYSTAKTYTVQIYGNKFMGVWFSNNTSVGKITKLISYGKWNNAIKSLNNAFGNATNLTEISATAFQYLTKAENFFQVFNNCTKLASVPADLFKYSGTSAKNFTYAFMGCKSLKTIPSGLFSSNTKATDFSHVFRGCTSLTTIPSDLFANNANATSYDCAFLGCSSLTTIYDEMFGTNTNSVSFQNTFSNCTSLTTIPSNIFANVENASSFYYTFSGCTKLINVSKELFKNNKAVSTFSGVFSGATGLKCVDIDAENSTTVNAKYSAYWPKWGKASMMNAKAGCKTVIPFKIKIKTTAANEEFSIPFYTGSENGNNNCTINWGDGSLSDCDTTTTYKNTHTYATAGEYYVQIYGNSFRGVEFYKDSVSAPKIIELVSYGDWDNIKSLYGAFEYASNLTTINQDAFKYIPNTLSFNYAFAYCSNLTSIPSGLFDNNTKVTSFQSTFLSCSSLASIPSGLFDKNTEVTNFYSTFSSCSKLTSIPSGLFDNNTKVTNFYNTFFSCSSLASIPSGLFDNNTKVTSFYGTFWNCSNLTSIPAGLFDKNTKVTSFNSTFKSCSNLTSILSGLFDKNTEVTDFTEVFYSASKLPCLSIDNVNSATEYNKNSWPKWNNGATMTNAKVGCKTLNKDNFIIKIKTTSTNESFSIPFHTGSENGTNNCTIDWGDGSTSTCDTTTTYKNSHTYATAGDYYVQISGTSFRGVQFSNDGVSASKITEIISYGNWTNIQTIFQAFSGATKLTTIDEDTFKYLTNLKNASHVFNACSSLKSVPSGLFKQNKNITTFNGLFNWATALESIPSDFFSENKSVTDFSWTFRYCRGLKSVPSELFANNTAATTFNETFRDCTSLESIPGDLFSNNPKISTFTQTFYGTSKLLCIDIDGVNSQTVFNKNSWPKWNNGATMTNAKNGCKLFDESNFIIKIKTTSANESFSIPFYTGTENGTENDCTIDWGDGSTEKCGTTSNSHTYSVAQSYTVQIYGNKFKGVQFSNNTTSANKITKLISYGKWNNTIKSLESAFFGASNLVEIDASTFQYLTDATSFDSVFSRCVSLTSIPSGLFDNNTEVTEFGGAFWGCSKLESIPSGLFNRNTEVLSFGGIFGWCSTLTSVPSGLFDNNTKATSFYGAFVGCSSLTSIPSGLFDNNSDVTEFDSIFSGCSSLTCFSIDGVNSEDIGDDNSWPQWKANGVNMAEAKKGCKTSIPFEIKIKTTTANEQFKLPYYAGGENGDNCSDPTNAESVCCRIDWGDGSTSYCSALDSHEYQVYDLHTYTTPGEYNIKITGGNFIGVQFGGDATILVYTENAKNVIEVISYGDWDNITSARYAFANCTNLTTVNPDAFKYLTNINDFEGTFSGATNLMCSNIDGIDSEDVGNNSWPKWNADDVAMDYAKEGCKVAVPF